MADRESKKRSEKSRGPTKDVPSTQDTSRDSFLEILEDLKKIGSPSDIGAKEDGIESESIALDYALGGIGVPRGLFTTITGQQDVGKSITSMMYARSASLKGLRVAIINREGRWPVGFAEKSGMGKPNRDYLMIYPEDAESTCEAIRLLADRQFDICILESIAALAPGAEISGEFKAQHVGLLPRIMSKFFRDAVLEVRASNMAVIMTNQIREKIGVVYGSPDVAPGGRAKDFYASVDIRLSSPVREYAIKAGKDERYEQIGATIQGYTKKSIGINHREIKYSVRFDPGLHCDLASEVMDFGLRLGIYTLKSGEVKRTAGGGWVYDGVELGSTSNEAHANLAGNPDLLLSLSEGIRQIVRTGAIIAPIKKREDGDNDNPNEE